MRGSVWIILAPALLLSLAGCKKQEAAAQQKTFHEIMKDEIDVRADDVWAIGNAHLNANAEIDPATMTEDDWKKLASAAVSVQQAALEIVNLKDPIVVAKPGVKISDEDVPGGDSVASVKANIDKDPQGLRDHANVLAQDMADLAEAASKHDAKAAGPIINQLDSVCESCHLEFWYPSQKALVNKIRQEGGDKALN
jgi:cytochrome c556